MPLRWIERALQGVSCLQLAQRSLHDHRFIPHGVPNVRRLHFGRPCYQKDHHPLRKELKDAARLARLGAPAFSGQSPDVLDDWELTVGIEVHAQLNTSRKLFSCV
jgi:hypothetical protein